MLCVWLPLLRVVLGSGPTPTTPASAPPASFITLFSSLSRLRLLGTMESFERGRWGGYGPWLWSCSPAAPSLPFSEGGILCIATGWSHFLGGPSIDHVLLHTQSHLEIRQQRPESLTVCPLCRWTCVKSIITVMFQQNFPAEAAIKTHHKSGWFTERVRFMTYT